MNGEKLTTKFASMCIFDFHFSYSHGFWINKRLSDRCLMRNTFKNGISHKFARILAQNRPYSHGVSWYFS